MRGRQRIFIGAEPNAKAIGLSSVSALEATAIDRNAQYLGLEPAVLMENAGAQVALEISKRRQPGSVAVLCGPGNNGGDGFVVARHLGNMGWRVTVVETREPTTPEAKRNYDIAHRMGGIEFMVITDSSQAKDRGFARILRKQDVLVDALLGTGTKGAPREPIASIIAATAGAKALKVAVDLPSGLDADTGGHEGEAFKGDLTISFHAPKQGFGPGKEMVGELVVVDIGIPKEAETLAGPGDLVFVRDRRTPDSHKGDNGVLLVLGGSKDYHGAPAICGMAALRTGIDLAYVVVPDAIKDIVAKHSPALVCRSYEGECLAPSSLPMVLELAGKCDAVCVGPGLGRQEETLQGVASLVDALRGKPLVLDADGLRPFKDRSEVLGPSTVVTPHAGEFKMLTGGELPTELDRRRRIVAEQASKTQCTWAVKGRYDIIASGIRCKVNETGSPCMTVGGTGDCLTGIIGGLMARHNDPYRSAVAGCFISGKAGEMAAEKKGCHILPTDVVEEIPNVFQKYG